MILPHKMSQDCVEQTGSKDGPGTEHTEDKDDEEKLEREKTPLNLKKKTKENTKNRDDKDSPSHHMKNGEEADKRAALEEGQMLESEIQTAIKKAHEASHSEFVAHPSPSII